MKKDLISIIVPVYNVEKYVEQCLESLIDQTYSNIEIIAVDDGSKDNSKKVVQNLMKKDKRIKYFYKENGGLSSARNYGINKSKGEYLLFIDSDDFVDYDMVEKMYEKAKKTKAEVVISPVTYIYENSVKKDKNAGESQFDSSLNDNPKLLRYINCIACNKLFKKSLFIDNKVTFPEGMYFEDTATIFPLVLLANKISLVNIPFYNYRVNREGSITSKVSKRNSDILLSCKIALDFYKEHTDNKEIVTELEKVCLSYIGSRYHLLYTAKNYEVANDYIKNTKKFLNENISNWKNKLKPLSVSRLTKIFMLHPGIFRLYLIAPSILIKLVFKLGRLLIRILRKIKKILRHEKKQTQEEIDNKKIENIQKNGLMVIEKTIRLLSEKNITCFADFGTLLGIVREKKLLGHDKDVDLGIVNVEQNQIHNITTFLERKGYQLWREFYLEDRIVEQSWHIDDIKVDLNYYQIEKNNYRTWLFYKDPDKKYKKGYYSTITMCYTGITGFEKIKLGKADITIPKNPTNLLEQKYGKGWKTPDKGWIYWKNPAAVPVKELGHFKTYQYVENNKK